MRRVRLRHVSVIAALMGIVLTVTATAGCNRQSASVTQSSVNDTFVDVDSPSTAQTRIMTAYPTEDLNLGNDSEAGIPQFLDGTVYTFAYPVNGDGEDIWTTAWDQATGKKLWSVSTNASAYSNTTFVSDGRHLFFVGQKPSPTTTAFVICLDKTTGATVWKSALVHGPDSGIAMRINEKLHAADRIYVVDGGGVPESTTPGSKYIYSGGIRILNADTGALLSYIDWPAFSQEYQENGQLLCDGATLYVSIPESASKVEKTALVAIDTATNKQLWTESVSGTPTDLVKEGDMLVVPGMFSPANDGSQWCVGVWKISTDLAKLLWTRPIDQNTGEMNFASIDFAVDSAHVYLEGSNGALMALDLATGKEVWRQQFASYKTPITDGPDVGKLYDLYPGMALTTTRNVLYAQDGGGLVVTLDPATGKKLWQKRISQITWGQTSVGNTFVFQPTDKGFVVILSDGTVFMWKQDAGGTPKPAGAPKPAVKGIQITAMAVINDTSSGYDTTPLYWNIDQNTLQSSGSACLNVKKFQGPSDLFWSSGHPLVAVQHWYQLWNDKTITPILTAKSTDTKLLIPTQRTRYGYQTENVSRWYAPEEKAFVTITNIGPTAYPKKTLDGMTMTMTEYPLASGSKTRTLTVPVPSGLSGIQVLYGCGGIKQGFVFLQTYQTGWVMDDSFLLLRISNGKATWIRCGKAAGFARSGQTTSYTRVGSLLYFTQTHGKIYCVDTLANAPVVTLPEKINTLFTKTCQERFSSFEGPLQGSLSSDSGTLIVGYSDSSWNQFYYAVDAAGEILGSLHVNATSVTSLDPEGKQGSSLSFKEILFPSIDLFESWF
jgi:hypothetical protein